MDNHEHSHSDGTFMVGLFLGGLLGAALIVLLGTEKGKKLAKKLADDGLGFLDEMFDSVQESKEKAEKEVVKKVEILEEKGKELLEHGQDLVEEAKVIEETLAEKIIDTKSEVTQQVVAQADAALAHIEAIQERGRKSTQELRKRLFKNIPKKTA